MGVFQGSALGPILFTVFANDMSLFAEEADVMQFADDTQVILSGKKSDLATLVTRSIESMEIALSGLDTWFRANALKVNAEKTQLIVFGNRQNLRNLPDIKVTFRDAVQSSLAARLAIWALFSINVCHGIPTFHV